MLTITLRDHLIKNYKINNSRTESVQNIKFYVLNYTFIVVMYISIFINVNLTIIYISNISF